MCSTGFPTLLACPQVSLVPPLRRRSRLKITVPSLSSMFLRVRAGYELVESSTRLYRSSIRPSSAFRPLGTYPPCSRPFSIAKSSAARSAPVWPPDIIFRSISKQRHFSVPIRTTPPRDRLTSALHTANRSINHRPQFSGSGFRTSRIGRQRGSSSGTNSIRMPKPA
jgi:hypothetical protein